MKLSINALIALLTSIALFGASMAIIKAISSLFPY